LSHSSRPFCSGYFGDGGLIISLPGLTLSLHPPDFSLPVSWDYRREPSVLTWSLMSCFTKVYFLLWSERDCVCVGGMSHLIERVLILIFPAWERERKKMSCWPVIQAGYNWKFKKIIF
jgi:hypothetical protein